MIGERHVLVGFVVNWVVVHADCTVAVAESGDGAEGAFFDAQGHADLVPPGSFAGTLCGGDVLGVVCRGCDHGVQLGEPGEKAASVEDEVRHRGSPGVNVVVVSDVEVRVDTVAGSRSAEVVNKLVVGGTLEV